MAKLNKTPLTIRSKRGTEAEITSYTGYQLSGEIAYATDTKDFYVSDGSQFNKIASFPFTGSAEITGSLDLIGDATISGNVGIGTTTPNQKLHIQDGNLEISPSGSGNYPWTGLSLGFGRNLPTKVGLFGASDGKVQYSDGNLYISTRNVNSGNGSYIQLGQRDSDNATAKGTIILQAGTYNVNGQTGDILLKYGDGDQLTLKGSTGKVGIGTTSPAGILHAYSTSAPVIESPSNAAMIIRRSDNVGYSSLLKYHSGNTEKFVAGLSDSGDFTGSTGEEYIIGTTKTNPLVVLKNDGKLGIGTTSPDSLLEIYSDSTTDFLKLTSGGGLASPVKLIFEKTTAEQGIIEYNRNGDLEIYNSDNDGGVMVNGRNSEAGDLYVADGGNVGIGTTLPSEKLTVEGNISASGDLAIQGFPSVSASLASSGGGGGGGSAFPFTGSAQIQGLGTTSATTAFRVENANADEILKVTDDGALDMPTLSSGSNIGLVKRDGDAFFYRFSYGNNGTTIPLGRNVFIGKNTGNFTVGATATANYMGSDNIGVGDNTLTNLTSGNRNIAIGQGVGASITTAGSNVMMGWGTGNNLTTGGENFLLGNFTGGSLTTHKGNVMIGTSVGQNIQGFYNVAIGDRALQGSGTNQSAGNNIAIGRAALQVIKASSDANVAIGSQALQNIGGNADGNIAIGFQTGLNNSGSAFDYNILIGYNVQAPLQNTGNQLNIGNLLYGTGVTSDQSVSTAGKVGIGTTSPTEKLTVEGNISASGDLAIQGFPSVSASLASSGGGGGGSAFPFTGSAQIQGLGTTSATTAFRVENATPSTIFDLKDNGQFSVGPFNDSISINGSNGRVTIAASNPALTIAGASQPNITFDGGQGSLTGLRTINRTGEIRINATQGVRFGSTSNSAGTRVSIVGDNNTTPFGIRQTPSGTTNNILATFISGSGDVVMGITADGGFTATDSTLVKRYVFEHGYAPAPADGLGIGLDLKTENASGTITSVGFIDVIQDDISEDENSMRISVGETTPTEVMRLQSDGNVGIGTTSPSAKLDVAGNIYPTTDNTYTLGEAQNKEWSSVATRMITGNNNRMVLQLSGDVVILRDHNSVGDGVQIKNQGSVVAQFGDAGGSGNVGIGTTSPSYKLDVSGSINHAGASYIVPATTSGASGATTVLTGATFDNATLIKASHDGVTTGDYTLELPAASSSTNRTIRIISDSSTDANHNIIIAPTSGDTLDGGTSGFTINRNYEGLMVWSDGSEWYVIQSKNV